MLNPEWLLDVLACPLCNNKLSMGGESQLVCRECRVDFSISATGQPDLRLKLWEESCAPQMATHPVVKAAKRIHRGVGRRLRTKLYEMGEGVKCCFCNWSGLRFLPAGRKQVSNRLCPRCGSLERYRALYLYLKEHSRIVTHPTYLLDVATKPCFRLFCQSLSNVKYLSSDLMTDGAMIFSNLTRMGLASEKFDIITCLHVMEHVSDDRAAFVELHRLLKPDGFAIVVVPIRGDSTLEDPNIKPEEYEKFYGQHDHIRFYGMDIRGRMEAAGLNVEVIDIFKTFKQDVLQRYALFGDDRYFFRLCRAA